MKKQNHTSHFALHTSQRGITLIALIITIIVMLILVGVTINVVLNGGLFEKADEAKRLTQLAVDKEELQIEIATAYDQKEREVDFSTLATNLRNKGWTVTESGDELICTSPKENTFTVYKNGEITEGGNHSGGGNNDNIDNSNELEKYFFNDDGTGKEGIITKIEDLQILAFADDEDTIPNASKDIEFMNSQDGYITVEYKGADYKIAITDSNVPTIGENGEKVIKLDNEVYPEGMTEDEIKIKQYFTGYSGTGKQFYSLIDMELSVNGPVFRGNSIISNPSKTIIRLEEEGYIIQYNASLYEVIIDYSNFTVTNAYKIIERERGLYTNEEVLKALGITNYTGTYTGAWKALEKDADGNPTKLVSTSAVANCTLGEEDNLEKSISDYKNAVSILNTSAQQATGIDSARSINVEDIETLAGIEDSDKGDEYNKPYTYNYTNHKDQIFVNESGATVKIDAEGKEVTLKNTCYSKQLSSDDIGTLASGSYWLASPCVGCNSLSASFYVRYVSYGSIGSYHLFSSGGGADSSSYGVRAVVSVEGL